MTTIFFTADTHFGHVNIIRYCNRPWDNVDDMNEGLIRLWNETVGPDDVVYHLGDFAMGKIADTLPIVKRLNGTIRLVPGNHDRCWPGHGKKAEKWLGRYLEAGFFDITHPQIACGIWDLCHFPFAGDHTNKDRYADWRPTDRGYPLLHGHVHDKWKINGEQINVGCDVWDYRPVEYSELCDLYHNREV